MATSNYGKDDSMYVQLKALKHAKSTITIVNYVTLFSINYWRFVSKEENYI